MNFERISHNFCNKLLLLELKIETGKCIPSKSFTGGHGESFSNNLFPWGENLLLPDVGDNNPDCNFTGFWNDGLCNGSADGKFLLSFEPIMD